MCNEVSIQIIVTFRRFQSAERSSSGIYLCPSNPTVEVFLFVYDLQNKSIYNAVAAVEFINPFRDLDI